MPNYRRFHVAGGTFFFTVKTERNAPIFRDEANVRLLGSLIREMKRQWPVEINVGCHARIAQQGGHALWASNSAGWNRPYSNSPRKARDISPAPPP